MVDVYIYLLTYMVDVNLSIPGHLDEGKTLYLTGHLEGEARFAIYSMGQLA